MLDFTHTLKREVLLAGFDDVGIAAVGMNTPYGDRMLESIQEGRHGPLDYMEKTAEVRADIRQLMPSARSVLVVVKNYHVGSHENFVSLDSLRSGKKISRYAWGGDYHHWFKKRLRRIRAFIQTQYPDAKVHIFNDTGPVLERAWAQEAGLGFIGKSSMFIHRRFGTWTFLGGLVTDLPLRADKPTPKQLCGSCSACLDACPTQAIIAPQVVDAKRCLTTWNVERPLYPQAQNFRGDEYVLGCDRCQEVCPWNKFEKVTEEERFWPLQGHVVLHKGEPLPTKLEGTPLARAGSLGLQISLERAFSINSKA